MKTRSLKLKRSFVTGTGCCLADDSTTQTLVVTNSNNITCVVMTGNIVLDIPYSTDSMVGA